MVKISAWTYKPLTIMILPDNEKALTSRKSNETRRKNHDENGFQEVYRTELIGRCYGVDGDVMALSFSFMVFSSSCPPPHPFNNPHNFVKSPQAKT